MLSSEFTSIIIELICVSSFLFRPLLFDGALGPQDTGFSLVGLSVELLVYAGAIVGFNSIKEQVANIPDTMFNIYRISLFGYASLVVLRLLRLAFDGIA